MKFIEAKEKLKVLAAGRYHTLSFSLTEYADGRQETECYIYVDPNVTARASTWERAFIKAQLESGVKQAEESPEV